MALPLLLASCSTPATSSTEPAPESPSQWTAAAPTPGAARDEAALARWWQQLNDPVLDRLIATALESNPDVRTATSRIAAARAQAGIERAALLPSVTASASTSGSRSRDRATDVVTSGESAQAGLNASWQLDLFGAQRASTRAAQADVATAEAELHGAQASLASEIATAYVTLRTAEQQLAVVTESLRLQGETHQIAQWREQSGNAGALDTQQSLSSLEQARASLPEYEQTLAQSRNQLAVLCGRAPGALDDLLKPAGTVPVFRAQLATGIPADTLRQRPDLAAAQSRVDAARARLTAAERERFPSLTLSGSLGVDALSAGKLTSPTAVLSSLAGSLSAPLFSSGRITRQIEVQDETARQALIAYESAVLTALQEVEDALVAVQRTAERGTILTRAGTAADQAAELASQQYAAGQASLLVVLDAQRSALSLRQQIVSNSADQTRASIQLYNALGGGWSS